MGPRRYTPAEQARFWRHPTSADVELLAARYVRHSFDRHTHDTYTIGVVEAGVEEYLYRGATHRVGPGGLALVEPDEVHTGHAGVPEGWRYRVLYPSPELMVEVAREAGFRGAPGFAASAVDAPDLAAHVRGAHLAAETGDPLTASTLLRGALAHLLRVAGRPTGRGRPASATDRAVAEARDVLHARLLDPPRLEELAEGTDTTPFALLRAFRRAYGLPPHAYLNQVRVRRARALLAEGLPPAQVAAAVGYADQPHLTRHFKRHVGVPPGSYQRGVLGGAVNTRGPGSGRRHRSAQ